MYTMGTPVNILTALISLFVLLSTDCDAVEFTVNHFKHAKLIKKEELPEFKKSNTISVLYYFLKDNPRHRGFYAEYDKSAEYLGLYNLKLGVVDCRDAENLDIDRCSQLDAPSSVFTYSYGNDLLALEIETMFDVNSMMSNILQLVLLREVPILQSEKEIESFINKHKGATDIIFSFQKAIGTYEHRIFMEVAYAFHHKFQFAISTSQNAVGGLVNPPAATDEARIWIMMCSQVHSPEEDCFVNVYDDKMDLSSLANFMRKLDLPLNFDIPGNGTSHPYTPDLGLHLVYLFYRETTKHMVQDILRVAGNQFHGKAAFLSINVELTLPEMIGLDSFPPRTPAIAVQFESKGKPDLMSEEAWSIDSAFEFFVNKLHEYNMKPKDGHVESPSDVMDVGRDDGKVFPDDGEEKDRYREEVETEDDHVAEAVQRARRIKLDIELALALTDETFTSTIKERDIVFTLFYLPFDHRSLAFLRAYGEAARKFENETDRPFTYVNCHDWTDVCAKEKITRYPTLKIFHQGKYLKDYDGMQSIEDVITAYTLLKQEKPVPLLEKINIEKFFNGILPDGSNISGSVFVVGLFADTQSKGVNTYQGVAKRLGDQFTFGINTNGNGKDFVQIYGCSVLPCIVVLKKKDIVQPYVAYSGDVSSAEELSKFIEQSLTPSLAELTPSLFPRLYKQKRAFVISFVDDTETSREMLDPVQTLVRSGSFPDLIFCSLQSGDVNSFGRQILQTYHNTTSSSLPALSYAHLSEGKVYNYMDKSFSKEQIEAWLRDVQSQKVENQPQFLLKDGKYKPRLQGYHFLEFLKEDEALRHRRVPNNRDPEVDVANIHGIGFDSEGNEVQHQEEGSGRPEAVDDSEVRKGLIDLQQSRLYHHAKERHKPPHTKHSDDQSQTVTLPTGEEPEGPITQGTEASGTEGPNTPGTQASGTESGSTPSSKKPIIHEDL